MSAPSARADDGPGTYRDVARAGVDRVRSLADGDDWAEAAEVARGLKRLFAEAAAVLGPVPSEVFDGMQAACLARDGEELDDFVALAVEIFP